MLSLMGTKAVRIMEVSTRTVRVTWLIWETLSRIKNNNKTLLLMVLIRYRPREKLTKLALSNVFKTIHRGLIRDIWRAGITCPRLTTKTFSSKRAKEVPRCVLLQTLSTIIIIIMVKTMENHYDLIHPHRRARAPRSPSNKHLSEPKKKLFSSTACQTQTPTLSISSRTIKRTHRRSSLSNRLY